MKQSAQSFTGTVDPQWRIGIVHSAFYKEEITSLVQGARSALVEAGIDPEKVLTIEAAGSFEVPLLGRALAQHKKVDAMIGLGIIVEGETHHASLLAEQAASGIMQVQIEYGIPFAFEILYVKDLQHAKDRSQGDSNKGREAAYAVLHSLSALKAI